MNKLLKTSCGVVILALWLIADLNAQTLQVKGGLNYATVTGHSAYSIKPAWYFGVAKDIRISKHISFQPEVLYSLQGAERESARYLYHYIQMPLYFNFAIGERAGILWGPQVGILTRANVNTRGERWSLLPLMKPFDISIGGGPYVKINDRLKAELRLAVGLSEISKEDERLRNMVIQAGLSWAITKPIGE
jgi:hypothetical protein